MLNTYEHDDGASLRRSVEGRHYEVVVPRDAVAHIHPDLADAALRMMEVNMRAEVLDAEQCLRTPTDGRPTPTPPTA